MLQTRACWRGAGSYGVLNGRRGSSGPQISVTPLIDVLLRLIIMFMLVVAMDPEYVEKAQIPQPDQEQTAERHQSRTIVIGLVWTTKDAAPT